jgi:uncharacterized membrane protein
MVVVVIVVVVVVVVVVGGGGSRCSFLIAVRIHRRTLPDDSDAISIV